MAGLVAVSLKFELILKVKMCMQGLTEALLSCLSTPLTHSDTRRLSVGKSTHTLSVYDVVPRALRILGLCAQSRGMTCKCSVIMLKGCADTQLDRCPSQS
jgi:hypothetical protein